MKKIFIVLLGLMVTVPLVAAEGTRVAGGVELCNANGMLQFHMAMPSYELLNNDGEVRIVMDGASYQEYPGYPRLPMLTYTFALPPGSAVDEVVVSGARSVIPGTYNVEASLPPLAFSASSEDIQRAMVFYEENRARVYGGEETLPDIMGELNHFGEQREYAMVTVAVYPFNYDPVSGELSAASEADIRISYEPVSDEHADFISRFCETGTIHPDVPDHIYNADQAREWYRPQARLLADPRMLVLTTPALVPQAESYEYWRTSTGFDVDVMSVDDVIAASSGVDDAQKIRNWLRDHVSQYDYLFIWGHYSQIPMRDMDMFVDGNSVEWYDDLHPLPTDLYFAGLSEPDENGWNKDGDQYWAEMMSSSGFPNQQDVPDVDPELYVGRINTIYETTITHILEKTWLFEYDDDQTYKEGSVLAGGILWFPNENGGGGPGFDAARFMEMIMDNNIVNSSRAITLYEKEGDGASTYACDHPLTQANLKSQLKNNDVGLFIENSHGLKNLFGRKVWRDNGDGIPYDNEIDWPLALTNGDCFQLNDDRPPVSFLMSCLNGYAEDIASLAQSLLNSGSVAVISATRSSLGRPGWSGPASGGANSMFYYIRENYVKNSATYDHVPGDAFFAGRLHYFNTEGSAPSKYINSFEHVLYGDPALRHMGRDGYLPGSVAEDAPALEPADIRVDAGYNVHFSMPYAENAALEVWDVAGRRVQTLMSGTVDAGSHDMEWDTDGLSSGTYFVTLRFGDQMHTAKAVVIQ